MEENFFSDDETLDALPEKELQALEDAAISSTQARAAAVAVQQSYHKYQQLPPPQRQQWPQQYRQQQQQQPPQDRYFSPAPSLPAAAPPVQRRPYQRPFKPPLQQRRQEPVIVEYETLPTLPYVSPAPQQVRPLPAEVEVEVEAASSDYGPIDFDLEIAEELFDDAAPRAEGEGNGRGGGGGEQYVYDEGQFNGEHIGEGYANGYGEHAQGDGDHRMTDEEESVLRRLEELRLENTRLESELANLKVKQEAELISLRQVKDGETSIVRSNLAKEKKEHARVITSLTNQHQANTDKLNAQIAEKENEINRLKTTHAFLEKENADYEKQMRSSKKVVISSGRVGRSPVTTPRKGKGMQHCDGFDDDEIMIGGSPSMMAGRRTPTKGVKRKRTAHDSPIIPLPFSQPRRTSASFTEVQEQVVDEALLERMFLEDDRFDVCPTEVSVGSLNAESLTVEVFAGVICKAALNPFLLPDISADNDQFGPLMFLLDLLQFSVNWDQGGKCHWFCEEAVELIQRTVDINAIPTFQKNYSKIEKDVDITSCLELLESIALGMVGNEIHVRRFWHCVRSDFPLILLSPTQPIEHIHRMASILCTSVTSQSFGPRGSNEMAQRQNESNLLASITRVLSDTPGSTTGEPRWDRVEAVELRKEIVQFLGTVAGVKLGIEALAQHQVVLPRLSKRIAEELEEVYEWKYGADRSSQFLNSAVRLLHAIITTNAQDAIVKLSGSTSYKHIASMTRMAFSDGVLQESGIEETVMYLAHEILEVMVTPHEGENLWSLFCAD
ncbi:hypothetical protein C7212DRAFT_365446 [Tuber magnatum]|uniref:DNA repair protein Rad26 n=1 Tax=Tuber magnatum TaxID=42249 RepID=A0A317SJM1_9PEZI|nr:hypothetical protein C7212DRAFT_365446 [Tuber magnatum]